MKKTICNLKDILVPVILTVVLASCIDNNETPPPVKNFVPGTLVTVDRVKSLYAGELARPWQQRVPVKIQDEWALAGIITASDKKDGNLYKEAYVQDGTTGLRMLFDGNSGLYIGDSVIVNLKGLYLGDYGNFIQLGSDPYTDASGNLRVSGFNMDSQILKVATGKKPVPQIATIKQVKSASWLGKLVKLENVQFSDEETGKTWADAIANPPAAANRNLTDCSSNAIIVRTSGYASFAGKILPPGKGSLTGIVTVFNSDYQIIVRDFSELQLDGDRCGYVPQPLGTPAEVISQNFESFANDASIYITGWQNIAQVGGRIWLAKVFSGNAYTQATGYNSGLTKMVTWLISNPVTISAQKILTFQTAKAYWAHTGSNRPMDVLFSTDYNGNNLATASWTNLTATLAGKNDPDHTFIDSGNINLPVQSGKSGVIAFRFTGSNTESTTYRIDKIKVTVK